MKKQWHAIFESEDEAMEYAEKYAGIVVHDIRWIDGQPHDIYHLWIEYWEDPRLKETWKDYLQFALLMIVVIIGTFILGSILVTFCPC